MPDTGAFIVYLVSNIGRNSIWVGAHDISLISLNTSDKT